MNLIKPENVFHAASKSISPSVKWMPGHNDSTINHGIQLRPIYILGFFVRRYGYEAVRRKMEMRLIKKLGAGFMILFFCAAVFGAEEKNEAKILLHGGNNGEVSFDHKLHQTILKDCSLCHMLFPQETGGIQKSVKEGKLKEKQVMNTLCINCHKEKKKAGVKAGPVTCSRCHSKK